MNTGDRGSRDPHESAEVRDEIDELFEGANPNPERVGCPARSALVRIARRRRTQDDPIYEHLERCSPCYREFRELRIASANIRDSRSRWVAAAGIAALVAIVVLAALWWRGWMREDHRPVVPLSAELDLRPYEVSRGEGVNRDAPALLLRTGTVVVTMILPIGAEPGRYDIQLLDAELKLRASATADAALRDYRTELRTTLNLEDVPPGRYQLALRYGSERWRLFPVEVR